MPYQLSNLHRNITDARLLADLQQTAKKLHSKTLTIEQYTQAGKYHFQTIARRFGTWNIALEKAGLTICKHYNIPIWSLFDNLRRLWAILGRQPYLRDLYPPHSRFGRRPYLRAFGTWRKALRKFITWQKHPHSRIVKFPNSHIPELSNCQIVKLPHLSHSSRAVPWRLRHLIMKRDHFKCVACGNSPATNPQTTLHVDHIIPWHKGGQTTFDNLQTLCSVCNIGKSDL